MALAEGGALDDAVREGHYPHPNYDPNLTLTLTLTRTQTLIRTRTLNPNPKPKHMNPHLTLTLTLTRCVRAASSRTPRSSRCLRASREVLGFK